MFVYSLGLSLALLLGSPWWLLRMATSGKYREGLWERLGFVPRRLIRTADQRPAIWVHAVSVGEVIAISGLVRELRERAPGYRVVISTTTRTGQKIARNRFGVENVFYFPLDFAWPVRRYLHTLRPAMLILVETEFWPRVLWECSRREVRVAVVNARISDRSYPRYLRLRAIWKRVLRPVTLALAQTEPDSSRLREIGIPAVRVLLGGNLKYDVKVVEPAAVTRALQQASAPGAKLLVCGSTLEGEEQSLIEAWPALLVAEPELRMILAPRHPERFACVAELLDRSRTKWVRRSQWMQAPTPLDPGSVLLLDSIGELASVYSLAAVAFVGGSLVNAGGHNPLEPAQFGRPILMGSHYANFREIVNKLQAREAIRIVAEDRLTPEILRLLQDENGAHAMGKRAQLVFASEAGATDRTVKALLELLAGDAA